MTDKPSTPPDFVAEVQALARAGRYRDVLALGDRYGREFLPRFTPEEFDRVSTTTEFAQKVVDLEDWEHGEGDSPAAGAAPTATGQTEHQRITGETVPRDAARVTGTTSGR